MTIQSKTLTAALALLILTTAGCHDAKVAIDQATTDKAEAFSKINTSITGDGTPRHQVVALMGYPVHTSTKGLFSVDIESLFFTDSRKMKYEITLIRGKTVFKSASPYGSPTTTKGN